MRYIGEVSWSLGSVALATGIALAAGAAVAYHTQVETIGDRSIEQQRTFVGSVADDLAETVASSAQNLRFLAEVPLIRDAVAFEEARRPASEAFVAYTRAHPDVLQLRLLGSSGHELIRVERGPSGYRPTEDLQDKSRRYYVQKGFELERGQVYVSRLDLNIERGEVQRPLVPVVRVVSGLFVGRERRPRGLVVANLDAQGLRDGFARWSSQATGLLALVDGSGNYLGHPDDDKLWGGEEMLDTGASFDRDDPDTSKWAKRLASVDAKRTGGRVIAAARVPQLDAAPFVVLIATEEQVVAASAAELRALAGWVAVVVVLAAAFLLLLWNARRADRERSTAVAAATSTTLAQAAAAVAHEIRNPLGAIVNSTGLLRTEFEDGSDSAELLDIVRSESGRLERIVDDFVELARPKSPRQGPVDLGRLVQDTVALARSDPRFTGTVRLDADVDTHTPGVRGDGDQIQQVLWNLLRNAGDAAARGGGESVLVRARAGRAKDAPVAVIEIEDDGPGLPPEDNSGRGRGGIGLVVATGIIARHDGHLTLAPRPGDKAGTVATVTLPANNEGSA